MDSLVGNVLTSKLLSICWCQYRQVQCRLWCWYRQVQGTLMSKQTDIVGVMLSIHKATKMSTQTYTGTFSTDNAVNTEKYIALRGNVELPLNERFASPRLTQSVEKRQSGVIIRNTTLLLIQFYSSQPTQIMHVCSQWTQRNTQLNNREHRQGDPAPTRVSLSLDHEAVLTSWSGYFSTRHAIDEHAKQSLFGCGPAFQASLTK